MEDDLASQAPLNAVQRSLISQATLAHTAIAPDSAPLLNLHESGKVHLSRMCCLSSFLGIQLCSLTNALQPAETQPPLRVRSPFT